MSTKIYTSNSAGGKFGVIDGGENIDYEPTKNRSCLVLVVGLLVVAVIILFIVKNWDSTSLLLSAGVFNLYTFKVSFYGDRGNEYWYPPVKADSYRHAVRTLNNDQNIESCTLKCIVLPDGKVIAGIRNLNNPTQYDIK